MYEPEFMIITVSSHASQRFEGCNLLGQLHTSAKIAGMPDLIHGFKELADPRIEHPVRI
jgi:hypothetical protein